ncbi:MAG: Ig-like domain-containing protein [Clostridia bacterium]|nr:Ig-like domain-containing protein [Clostridia bacterium]
MRRQFIALLFTLLLLVCCTVAQADSYTFKFDVRTQTVYEGDTIQLTLTRTGLAEGGVLSFKSSNENVASVDDNGLVTTLKKGQTVITATVKTEKNTFRTQTTVNVWRKVTSIGINESRLTILDRDDASLEGLLQLDSDLPVLVMNTANSLSLQVSAEPDTANNRRIEMTTSDDSIVRISGTTLNPKKTGECIITVQSQSNPEVNTSYHLFIVQRVTNIKVTPDNRSTDVGGTIQMRAEVGPKDATIKDVTWSSLNEKVAVVDENGRVTGKARGQAEIRATSLDGSKRYGSYTVTIAQQAESITLKSSSEIIAVGYNRSLQATVLPNNTNDKIVIWSSSDEKIAKVNQNGYITPVKAGECEITATAKSNPAVFAVAKITITQPVTKIAFTEREVSVNVGESVQLYWNVEPADVTDDTLSFSVNNQKVASVDASGLVTGIARGDVTVTARAVDGSNRQARITVHVIQPVLGVHMKSDTVRVGVNEGYTLNAVLEPENANNRNMTWTIDDTYYAVIRGTNNRPTVTGKHWGQTVAHGVTEDGGFTVECIVNVGNYDRALKITDLYLQDNAVKIVVENQSNMNVTRFYGIIALYDIYGQPLPCTTTGVNSFDCSYRETLYEGDITRHGRFYFNSYAQPAEQIGRVTMTITGYDTDEGYSRNIRDENYVYVEYQAVNYIGHLPEPEPAPEVAAPAE